MDDSLENKAEEAERSGDLHTAFRLWRELTTRNQSPLFFCRFGRVAEALGRWDDAEAAFCEALRLDPKLSLAMECMGSLWLTRIDKDHQESMQIARDWLLEALRCERTARVLTFLGSANISLGDESAARRAFEEAITLDPSYEEALFNLALLESSHDTAKASVLLQKALDLDPTYSAAHRELGILTGKAGDLATAERHLRRALELNPSDYWAHLHLANLLAVQGNLTEAEQTYRFATALHPEIKEGSEIFARFLDSVGKKMDAEAVRQQAGPPPRP